MAAAKMYRWAVSLALVCGFQVALSAAFELAEGLDIETSRLMREESPLFGSPLSVTTQRQVWLAQRTGYQTAVSGMQPWRAVGSAVLILSAGLVFVFAMRLRMASESPVQEAKRLGLASLGAAFVRATDGAMNLVIDRTIAREVGQALIREKVELADHLADILLAGNTAKSIVWSFMIITVFMGLSSYFQNPQLHEALARESS
jgi:hypothetical protein